VHRHRADRSQTLGAGMTLALALFAAYIWTYLVGVGSNVSLRRFVFGWPAIALILSADLLVWAYNRLLDEDAEVIL
jgi:hypothetical protein